MGDQGIQTNKYCRTDRNPADSELRSPVIQKPKTTKALYTPTVEPLKTEHDT